MNPLGQIETSAALLAGLALAAIHDASTRRIPNWLNATLALAGVLLWTIFDGGAGTARSLGGVAALIAIGFIPFKRGWLGAGDVKLLAAVGAWVGIAAVPQLVILTALCGGALSLGLAAARRIEAARKGAATVWRVPYGIAIAAGGVLTSLAVTP